MPSRQPSKAVLGREPAWPDEYSYAVARRATKPKQEHARGELALIQMIRARAARASGRSSAVRLGIGDDCAILKPPLGHEILVTTDFSLEGRHFRRDWHSPESVGHRTLARGLSDLASMGARPLAVFLSLALPKFVASDSAWLDGFLDGLLALASMFKVPLAGGDLSEAPSEHILADIMLLGSAPAGTALRRSGARAGDLIYCTGSLGGAAVQLAAVATGTARTQKLGEDDPHLFPAPRVRVGEALRSKKLATSCIDLSDGLSTDLAHLCEASGVDAEVDARRLTCHPLTQTLSREKAWNSALHGGEDYELLFTASPGTKMPRSLAGVPITRIGSMTSRSAKPVVTLIGNDGSRAPLKRAGWEHLR